MSKLINQKEFFEGIPRSFQFNLPFEEVEITKVISGGATYNIFGFDFFRVKTKPVKYFYSAVLRKIAFKKHFIFLFFVLCTSITFAQKDSLQLGDKYADDQIYASISYAQFDNQPTSISKSGFSYALSTGFLKDFTLNKRGNISFAAGVGYGYDNFNHELKVEEINNSTVFSSDNTLSSNKFTSHNIEFPVEIRWRTSTANKYKFWRVYTGIKFLYNFSNRFEFTDASNTNFSYSNVTAYNKFQYGLTLSAGYDAFNIHLFYGLTPIFKNAAIGTEKIDTTVLKFGLIFYIL